MDLLTYITTPPRRGLVARLAGQLEVPPALVSQWAWRRRAVPLERCMPIERATAGSVRRWDLRPDDWHVHWPELIDTEGSPDAPATTEARDAA